MTESTISLDYARLVRSVGRAAWYGRDPSLWVSGLAYKLTDVLDAMNDGLARFYGAFDWSFLKVGIEVPFYAPYSTGTIAIASGVVTLSGGTFPAWAGDGDLIYGTSYEVAVRTDDTHVTLKDTSVSVTAGATYSLVNSGYTLPDDFGHFIGDHLTYRPGDTAYPRRLHLTTIERIRDELALTNTYTDRPRYGAVIPLSDSTLTYTLGQRSRLQFWPVPSVASRVRGRYRVVPNTLTSTNKYPYGGMLHGPTILAACCAEAEGLNEHSNGAWEARFQALLAQSIARDKAAGNPSSLGFDLGTGPGNDIADDPISPLYGLPELNL